MKIKAVWVKCISCRKKFTITLSNKGKQPTPTCPYCGKVNQEPINDLQCQKKQTIEKSLLLN